MSKQIISSADFMKNMKLCKTYRAKAVKLEDQEDKLRKERDKLWDFIGIYEDPYNEIEIYKGIPIKHFKHEEKEKMFTATITDPNPDHSSRYAKYQPKDNNPKLGYYHVHLGFYNKGGYCAETFCIAALAKEEAIITCKEWVASGVIFYNQ